MLAPHDVDGQVGHGADDANLAWGKTGFNGPRGDAGHDGDDGLAGGDERRVREVCRWLARMVVEVDELISDDGTPAAWMMANAALADMATAIEWLSEGKGRNRRYERKK